MNIKAQNFIKAIKTAESSSEVIRLWTEAAKGTEFSIKEIVEIHQACGSILVEAVHNGTQDEEAQEKAE